jgi:hypothetical protein
MVEISVYGSGEGPGWVTGPGYSTTGPSQATELESQGRREEGAGWWPVTDEEHPL